MFGLVGCCAVVGTKKIGGNPLYGILIISIFVIGRIVLVLPFCPQPRFDIGGLHGLIGSIIFVIGVIFGLIPAFHIKPLTAADEKIELKTAGFYKFVRNPIYLGEVLYTLGWAIIFRSIIGVALVPMWWVGLLVLVVIEEERLELKLGKPYLDYKKRIRGRIIPSLPI
jgi:protein-S-isoprenylcysteine O-methyltransferase Ste14